MAFNGNLHEFGIVALIQLPNTNRLTGLLSIEGETDRVEFYYNNGKLFHAAYGEIEGKQVVAAIIDWTEGEFTFESDKKVQTVSIEEDLHHLLMWALKERDERKKKEDELKAVEAERQRIETEKAEEVERQRIETEKAEEAERQRIETEKAEEAERQRIETEKAEEVERQRVEAEKAEESRRQKLQETADALPPTRPDYNKLPDDLLVDMGHTHYACVANASGVILAETVAEEDFLLSVAQHWQAISSFIKNYPDGGVGKTFIEDKEFSIAVSGIKNGDSLVLFAAPNTRLGTLSMELSKFIRKLESTDPGENYEKLGKR